MIPLRLLLILNAGLLAASFTVTWPAAGQQSTSDNQDKAIAFAQCVRDNGYDEFPDPDPEGGFKFLIKPDSVARFKAATAACRDLAPEGMRGEGVTPEQLDDLIKLSQCVRKNGIPDFPDPGPQGNFDLTRLGLEPGNQRLEAAMATCRADSGDGPPIRITVGG